MPATMTQLSENAMSAKPAPGSEAANPATIPAARKPL